MPDLLLRGIDPELKRLLAVRAAENGRSQSAEAIAILEQELAAADESTFGSFLLDLARNLPDGPDLVIPNRHDLELRASEQFPLDSPCHRITWTTKSLS